MATIKQKITPFLWFNDNQTEEAVKFYTSVFKNSKILSTSRYGEAGPGPKGGVMAQSFELEGQQFVALNGDVDFKFNESISFVINCETQQEIDYYWEKLTAGGKEIACGWLKDKFGLCWQVTPTIMPELMTSNNAAANARVMKAMMQMIKLDIATLQEAAQEPVNH